MSLCHYLWSQHQPYPILAHSSKDNTVRKRNSPSPHLGTINHKHNQRSPNNLSNRNQCNRNQCNRNQCNRNQCNRNQCNRNQCSRSTTSTCTTARDRHLSCPEDLRGQL
jgi:hypothetical protein